LIDYLFERPEEGITLENENIRVTLFDQLVGFLDNDVLNYTSAGYFAKVFCAIIKLRGYDVNKYINLRYGQQFKIMIKFYLD
jgi:serine/threonine-protein phosphatase 6 regulatory subunit 3